MELPYYKSVNVHVLVDKIFASPSYEPPNETNSQFMKPKTVHFIGKKYLAEFKHHVDGKRQIQVENFSKQKMCR